MVHKYPETNDSIAGIFLCIFNYFSSSYHLQVSISSSRVLLKMVGLIYKTQLTTYSKSTILLEISVH